jgi:hypothetical protein
MGFLDAIATLARDYVGGVSPRIYVGVIAASCVVVVLFRVDASGVILKCQVCIGKFLYYPILLVLFASIIGFFWGNVPINAFMPVAITIWVQLQVNERRKDDLDLERLKRVERPTGAVPTKGPLFKSHQDFNNFYKRNQD